MYLNKYNLKMSLSFLLFFFPYIVLSLPENEIEFERQENYDAESM